MEPINASLNIVGGADIVAPAAPPFTYIGVAENLLPGVRVLADTPDTRGMPLALLSGHVLECLLKAFLSKALGSDEALKKDTKLRHNLLALWSLAKQKGLALPAQTPSRVECLSGLHDHPFNLRYSKGVNVIISPAAEPMASDLQQLLGVVRNAVQ